jgi:Family of unknown function (DUF6152)
MPDKEITDVKCSLLVLLTIVIAATPVAYAHHSMAMFDAGKTVTLEGTVKSFKWTSPHAFIEVTVPYKEGPIDWSIEMGGGGVSTLLRAGWTPTTIKFGDKVIMKCHPLRNGNAGGNFVSLTLPDGKIMTLGANGN